MPDNISDVIIIGGGPGGYVCAIRAAQLGMSVTLVEQRGAASGKAPALGGTCLNVGCIPSKALLDSSEHYLVASKHLKEHGVLVSEVSLDLSKMLARKDKVVAGLVAGVAHLMKKHNITVVGGKARLGDGTQVIVQAADGSEQILKGRNVVLAMGSVPSSLPSLPVDGTRVMTSTEALTLPEVPKHLVVVGGGVIGLELGSVWARLGAKVTVVEYLKQIVPGTDPELAGVLQKSLAKLGIAFELGAAVQGVEQQGENTIVVAKDAKGAEIRLEADRVLVAVGRRANSGGLAEAGITLDERGRVVVNDRFCTNRSGVYAIGDLIAGPMLAHKAEEEGVAVAELLAGKAGHVDHDLIPGVVYTDPELALIGISEAQAKERNIAVRVGRFPFMANGRAKAAATTDGLVKVIADAKTDRLLGVGIVGPRASDLIAECAAIMSFGGSSEDIARLCHAHPTFSEAVKEAALDAGGRILHG